MNSIAIATDRDETRNSWCNELGGAIALLGKTCYSVGLEIWEGDRAK
ncbi:MAG: hypothetical protein AAGA60_22185 [Cyanobacteria bacterium P01_E01_bin.42]